MTFEFKFNLLRILILGDMTGNFEELQMIIYGDFKTTDCFAKKPKRKRKILLMSQNCDFSLTDQTHFCIIINFSE